MYHRLVPTLLTKSPAWAGFLLALALIGCTTALAITGHISGDAALATFGLVGGAGGGIVGAHIGGQVANNATSPPGSPTPPEKLV